MKLRLFSHVALILAVFHIPSAYAHECDSILSQGVRNSFAELRKGDLKSAFRNQYCNKQSTSQSTTSGESGSGSAIGYGDLNFGKNSGDTRESRSENCGGNSGEMSDEKYVSAMASVVDQGIVSAWKECKAQQIGVMILGELNGSDLAISYKFRAAGSESSTVVTDTPKITGATCDKVVRKGTRINTGGKIQSCQRNGTDPITITVNTKFAPAKFFIPALPAPSKTLGLEEVSRVVICSGNACMPGEWGVRNDFPTPFGACSIQISAGSISPDRQLVSVEPLEMEAISGKVTDFKVTVAEILPPTIRRIGLAKDIKLCGYVLDNADRRAVVPLRIKYR
jgi:hypothetical protein